MQTHAVQKFNPSYSKWRHGGWYVHNVKYPSGACGCVSRNYDDGKWRIVCDERRVGLGKPGDFTFSSRDAAAQAEYDLVMGKVKEHTISYSYPSSDNATKYGFGKEGCYTFETVGVLEHFPSLDKAIEAASNRGTLPSRWSVDHSLNIKTSD